MAVYVHNKRRGFGMLGLIAMISLMAFLCAAVSISSSRSVAGSLRGIQRLQTLAAAEGVAVMLASGIAETSGTVQLGDCRVTYSPSNISTDTATTAPNHLLTVDVLAGERTAYTRSFLAAVDFTTANVTLEALP